MLQWNKIQNFTKIIFCSYATLTTRCYSIINHSMLLICNGKKEENDNETFFLSSTWNRNFYINFCCYQSKESHHLVWCESGGKVEIDAVCLTDSLRTVYILLTHKFISTWLFKKFSSRKYCIQIFKCTILFHR